MLAKHLVKNPKFKLNFRRLWSPIVTLANLKFGRSERAKETQKICKIIYVWFKIPVSNLDDNNPGGAKSMHFPPTTYATGFRCVACHFTAAPNGYWPTLHQYNDLCQCMKMLDGGTLQRIARQRHGTIANQILERARGVSNSLLASIFASERVNALE